ncbi:MAG: HAMP domain-containing protein [Acidobacteria bacterium]|nr:HAMP domain-containing protein [Acidobacteriota bacterium]
MRRLKSPASKEHRFAIFHSIRNKLLVLMIALSLLPLAGMSIFYYFIGRNQIQERIRLSLGKMAQDTADKVDLLLRGKKEEIHLMATTFPLIFDGLNKDSRDDIIPLLNNYCFQQDVYDLLIVLDVKGKIVGINTTDRNRAPLPAESISEILGADIANFSEEHQLFQSSITGHNNHLGWYRSRLVQRLYDYRTSDASHQYDIAFSEPIIDPGTREVVGVWINVLNWSYFQNILDPVEMDLSNLGLSTGYAFMTASDANTIIGHKYRLNRKVGEYSQIVQGGNYYDSRLIENHKLENLHKAILNQDRHIIYDLPNGQGRITGLAPIEDTSLGWIVGVEIDESDIYRPIRSLIYWLLGAIFILSLLVIFFTYIISRGISVPLNNLIRSATTISQGNFNERVLIQSSDEVGLLASTFNEMARTLSSREMQLQELNRNLEDMVRDRTLELENSHEALKRAYYDLQSAQEQLVQTEKMASLGQLVAGIAHEIKNPLNFIYGNTGFLADYIQKIQDLLEMFEKLPSLSAADKAEIERMKDEVQYSFIKKDLNILIDNFTDGSRRINTIVSDLRTFSRMDRDEVSEVDLHASLEMSLNLLRNQYKNRIEIHKEYGDIPKIQGYPGKLNQVFMNLLSNAFQAIKDKGEVWLRTRTGSGTVEIEISDNGSGIAQENIKRIFEPFYTTKPVGQGTGLGLSISYGIVEQHGGKIQVVSAPRKGSTFTILLPIFQEKAL